MAYDGSARAARISPMRRRLAGWTLAAVLTLALVALTIQDHRSRQQAVDAEVAGLSASTASAVELAISQAVGRLEVTAVQLLDGDVDRDILMDATPFADAPLTAVIDVEAGEFLAINFDLPDVDITLDLALQALPNLRQAMEGTTGIGHLALPGEDGTLASIAVPFTAADGSRRVFATGFELGESTIARALATDVAGVEHRLVGPDDAVLLTGATSDSADPEPTYDRGATSSIEGAPWQVRTRAATAVLEPTLTRPLNSMWLQMAAIIIGMAGVTALWTRSVFHSEELERSYERLARAGHHQREATAIIAHELRTPVTRALGMTSILTARRDRLSDDQVDDMLKRTHRAAESLARLLDDLQIVVESSAAVVDDSHVTIGVADLVRLAVQHLPDDVALDTTGVPGHLTVTANGTMAERLLLAIVRNAATHGGGHIDVSATTEGHQVRVDVRDHGPGVDPAFVEDLFTPFTQGNGHLDREHGGLGVGLAVARNLAQGMGGAIRYEPAEPGARFVIHLPAGPTVSADA